MDNDTEFQKIEFEGKTVWKNKGYWKCPFRCHDTSYPAPKWKTDAGFRRHMEKCTGKPSAVKKRLANAAIENQKREKKEALEIAKALYKIGDEIFFVWKIEVKGKYEQRGTRSVKVRYEAICRFEARKAIIRDISYRPYSIYYNGGIAESTIFESMEEAEKQAKEKQVAHDEWRKECARCR